MPVDESATETPVTPVTAATLREWLVTLPGLRADADSDRVEVLGLLESLKAVAAGVQAKVTVDLDASQRAVQRAAGVPERRVGAGIAAQVALARRDSPAHGSRHLGLGRALVEELPGTLAALLRGETTEWRATLVARETACLSRRDRWAADAELTRSPQGPGGPSGLAALGDGATVAAARRVAYRLDPVGFTARAARAEKDRRVTLRPAPDTMSHLSGLLPVRSGVAVLAALTRHADSRRAAGDSRTRGQIMADTLVERVTGRSSTDGNGPAQAPMEVQLVVTDRTMLAGDPEPAYVPGYGPIPAGTARSWITGLDADTGAGIGSEAAVWLRRLYTHPGTGELVAMDSRARYFPRGLRRFVIARDQICRTPWCGAAIRHLDHPARAADGGTTSGHNSQGLCEACNYVKEAPGWHTTGRGSRVETTTPTGHTRASSPPALAPPPPRDPTRLEARFTTLVLTA